jgi:glycosyltransferase involved in cell wall biosynthesis
METRKIDSMISELHNWFEDHDELDFENEVKKEINKAGGLLDYDSAIIALYKNIFSNETPNVDENSHSEFLEWLKPKLSYIVNNRSVRDLIVSRIYNDGNKNGIRNFKFGIEQMAQKKHPNRTYSGENWSGYIFVLGRKRHFHEQYGEFTTLNCIVWNNNEKEGTPYSIIVPKFLKAMESKNAYYTLFYVEYQGLVQSERHKERKFHSGSCLRVAKINKTVQSSL